MSRALKTVGNLLEPVRVLWLPLPAGGVSVCVRTRIRCLCSGSVSLRALFHCHALPRSSLGLEQADKVQGRPPSDGIAH